MRDAEKHIREEDKGGSDSLTTTRLCGCGKTSVGAFSTPLRLY